MVLEVIMTVSAGNRVLMLLENNPYPSDSRVRQEAKALVEAGFEVTVVSPKGRREGYHEVVDGVHVYRYPAPAEGNSFLGYLWEYGYSLLAAFGLSLVVFARRGFDIIHAHNPPDLFVFIAIFYKLFGTRFVFDHHDLAPENYHARFREGGSQLVYNILVWLEQLSCQVADHVIATNESYKTIEMERGRVPEDQITIVRNGPDLDRLQLTDPDPELRRKAGTIIGFVGEMGPQDGLDYLLRALRHLVYDLKRTDFYCVIIGTGSELANLKKLGTQLGLDDYVWFTGRISDEALCQYLSTADICVSADPYNPFNDRCTMIKMMEYMTFGKPIVAFDLTEHRFTAQSAALYVPDNNELNYAQSLVQLMDDPQRRKMMGSFGRQRIETELAWQYSVSNLLKAYHSLLPKTVQPGQEFVHP